MPVFSASDTEQHLKAQWAARNIEYGKLQQRLEEVGQVMDALETILGYAPGNRDED